MALSPQTHNIAFAIINHLHSCIHEILDALIRKAFENYLDTYTLFAAIYKPLAHGRRQFTEVAENFPDECRYVLDTLGEVYGNDAWARDQRMTPDERLKLHQEKSKPLMDQLHQWMTDQLNGHQTEPNSGLGKAMTYLLRHWRPLTLFLRQAGAPLDNNIVERAIKKAVLHRKNALFYRTIHGAQVGDLFMSFIHTCELNAVNSFDYLTELQRHAAELLANPAEWMPWDYRDAVLRVADG